MGGGAMRSAAAKVAGGLRGIMAENNPVVRRASFLRPAAAATKTEDVKLEASSNCEDWVLAGAEEDAGMTMPRVVFGDVPTMEEAREATYELSEALDKAYLSSPHSVRYEGSSLADHESSLALSSSRFVETKDRVTSEVAIAPAVPAPAIMAFKLLHESTTAQTVVASIASDPNVWNAVLQNRELQGFLQSQETYSDSLDQSSPKSVGSESQAESEPVGGGFMGMLQKIKLSVVEMMSGLSGFFRDFFGGQGGSKVFANSDGTAGLSTDAIMGKSFMGLAVMAILVILLKRRA